MGSSSQTRPVPLTSQTQAPSMQARYQQRFKTLGFQPSVRDRLPTLGSQAYPRRSLRSIGAQPRHGLVKGSDVVALRAEPQPRVRKHASMPGFSSDVDKSE